MCIRYVYPGRGANLIKTLLLSLAEPRTDHAGVLRGLSFVVHPVLPAVPHVQDFDRVVSFPIHKNIRCPRHDALARTFA